MKRSSLNIHMTIFFIARTQYKNWEYYWHVNLGDPPTSCFIPITLCIHNIYLQYEYTNCVYLVSTLQNLRQVNGFQKKAPPFFLQAWSWSLSSPWANAQAALGQPR